MLLALLGRPVYVDAFVARGGISKLLQLTTIYGKGQGTETQTQMPSVYVDTVLRKDLNNHNDAPFNTAFFNVVVQRCLETPIELQTMMGAFIRSNFPSLCVAVSSKDKDKDSVPYK